MPTKKVPADERQRRQYTDEDMAAGLLAVARFDGKDKKASEATGIPGRTLRRWWNELSEAGQLEYLELAKAYQEHFWQTLHDAAIEVAIKKVEDMSARDAVIAAGISFDKLRLLRGEATDIQGTLASDAESLAKSVEDILSKVTGEAVVSEPDAD